LLGVEPLNDDGVSSFYVHFYDPLVPDDDGHSFSVGVELKELKELKFLSLVQNIKLDLPMLIASEHKAQLLRGVHQRHLIRGLPLVDHLGLRGLILVNQTLMASGQAFEEFLSKILGILDGDLRNVERKL